MTATNQFCETKERSGIANTRWISAKPAIALGALTSLAERFGRRFKTYLHVYQVARMKSVLMNLTDFQLEKIGITRAEIATYSERLISDDTGCPHDGREQKDRS